MGTVCTGKCQDKEFIFYMDVRGTIAHVQDRSMYGYCTKCSKFMRGRAGMNCKCCGSKLRFRHVKNGLTKRQVYRRNYYQKNKDHIRTYQLAYYHKPEVKAKRHEHYLKNKDKYHTNYLKRREQQKSHTMVVDVSK